MLPPFWTERKFGSAKNSRSFEVPEADAPEDAVPEDAVPAFLARLPLWRPCFGLAWFVDPNEQALVHSGRRIVPEPVHPNPALTAAGAFARES